MESSCPFRADGGGSVNSRPSACASRYLVSHASHSASRLNVASFSPLALIHLYTSGIISMNNSPTISTRTAIPADAPALAPNEQTRTPSGQAGTPWLGLPTTAHSTRQRRCIPENRLANKASESALPPLSCKLPVSSKPTVTDPQTPARSLGLLGIDGRPESLPWSEAPNLQGISLLTDQGHSFYHNPRVRRGLTPQGSPCAFLSDHTLSGGDIMEARTTAAGPSTQPLIRKMRTKFPIWVLWGAADNAYNSSYEKMRRSYSLVRKITPKPKPCRPEAKLIHHRNRSHRHPPAHPFCTIFREERTP